MDPSSPDPADVVARLEAAAERLRAQDTRPQADRIEAEDRRGPRAGAGTAAELSDAQLRMRAARKRLAELEAELGWDVRIRRGP